MLKCNEYYTSRIDAITEKPNASLKISANGRPAPTLNSSNKRRRARRKRRCYTRTYTTGVRQSIYYENGMKKSKTYGSDVYGAINMLSNARFNLYKPGIFNHISSSPHLIGAYNPYLQQWIDTHPH